MDTIYENVSLAIQTCKEKKTKNSINIKSIIKKILYKCIY